jgi:hypothetical protein
LLKLWSTDSGELVKSIKKHTDWITALDVSPDGVLVASGDRNGGVWVWESDTGNEFHTLRAHQAGISAAVFRADSNILASASEDGTIRFWEMNGGSEVKKIDAHPGGVTAFSFARDGSSLSAGRDSKAKFWKPDFNHSRDIVQNLPNLPTAVALDAEAKTAFIGDASGMVLAFNTADGKKLGEIPSNPPTIDSRIQTITANITTQEQALTKANQSLVELTAAHDQVAKALAEAEKARNQAVEIHKAAEAGATATPDDASKKIAMESLARIQPAEQSVLTKHAELAAAAKSLTDATAARDAAQAPIHHLKLSLKRWNAAAINTRLLNARHLAATSSVKIEDSQFAFSQAAQKVAVQAEILNRKRAERDQLAARALESEWPPETREEFAHTLAAIDLVIARELDAYRAAESGFEQTAQSIDPAARLSFENQSEVTSLHEAYQAALK